MSSSANGSSQLGVTLAVFGLSFQVFTLCIFIGLCVDYFISCHRCRKPESNTISVTRHFTRFTGFLSAAIILILLRCAYRIDELSGGYSGSLIHNQGLFIGLEGVPVIVAACLLCFSHPGPVFGRNDGRLFEEALGRDSVQTKEATVTAAQMESV